MNLKAKIKLVVDALEDVKAQDITVLDTSKLTSLFECMVIATGTSNRQTRSLADNVRVKMKEADEYVGNTEGEDSGEWVLLDLGEIIVHVMQPAARAHYNLEELWGAGEAARARHIQPDH
ncbi:MAG TPA: ribosome silencing factor [Thiobacillus sp.]